MNGLPEAEWLLADRGYDADWFHEALIDNGTKPCIPGRKSRKKTVKYDKRRYKRRNRIEKMFGRLKHWRRVALAATVIFWLLVLNLGHPILKRERNTARYNNGEWPPPWQALRLLNAECLAR
jgi:transposase